VIWISISSLLAFDVNFLQAEKPVRKALGFSRSWSVELVCKCNETDLKIDPVERPIIVNQSN